MFWIHATQEIDRFCLTLYDILHSKQIKNSTQSSFFGRQSAVVQSARIAWTMAAILSSVLGERWLTLDLT
jgi:hypothetical protein